MLTINRSLCRVGRRPVSPLVARCASTMLDTTTSRSHSSNRQELDSKKPVHNPTLDEVSSGDVARNNLLKDEKTEYYISHAFTHPQYTEDQMKQVTVAMHQPLTVSDKIARMVLSTVRRSFDFVTGYKHPPPGKEGDPKYLMTKEEWLRRFVFLESIAGVPGMVAGMVRHLHSLRLLKRDRAWIETLWEEAYNERMHLLTFIKLTKPSFLMKLMILGAQGVFFNAFFISYLMFPRICHRFVGYLEEEAVATYTRCINDMERGHLQEFASMPAPDIAVTYWHMKPGSTVKDVIYYVRADESKHREVNHTLGNMKQDTDPNPYALNYSDLPPEVPRPTKDLKFSHTHPVGWTRKDIEL